MRVEGRQGEEIGAAVERKTEGNGKEEKGKG